MVLVLCTSSAHPLMVPYICTKFRENISKGFRVIHRTRLVMDRQTDNYGKNNMSPTEWGIKRWPTDLI